MAFLPMKNLLDAAARAGYAVPSFCIWDAQSMQAVLETAARLNAPVILMCGPGEFPLLRPAAMGAVARAVAAPFRVRAALHLDHGNSLDQVRDCLEAGFSSVMLDFSTRPYEENANALKRVVEMARPFGATVEGEIGAVGKVDAATTEGGAGSTLTDPDEARRYAEETGVDALAISIGNAHGIYAKLPQFDFERLGRIRAVTRLPLVLHGGSGTPDADLRRAISLGIAKVNVASELIGAVRESLRAQWSAGRNLWTPAAFTEAAGAMAAVAERWIRRTGAEGQG